MSAFTSVVREHLDPLVKADQCAQYVDDIGIAAHPPEELTLNLFFSNWTKPVLN